MKELFEKTMEANRKYVGLVNANSADQLTALDTCKALMGEIINLGLCTEYREFCERLSIQA